MIRRTLVLPPELAPNTIVGSSMIAAMPILIVRGEIAWCPYQELLRNVSTEADIEHPCAAPVNRHPVG